jgi:recombining binding protein (suppressor of hairless)
METGWTLRELLPPSATPESRSKAGISGLASHAGNGHNNLNISASTVAPRPIPPFSQHLSRWPLHTRTMSVDFPSSTSQSMYAQSDIEHPYQLHNSSDPQSSPSAAQSHPFDHSNDQLDPPEHSNYDLFPNSTPPSSFPPHRYPRNASSSSTSLGPGYGMNSDGMYQHPPFGDSVPPFSASSGNPYDMITSLPSSYGSGKVSPLTPSDPVGGLHHAAPGFTPSLGGKDFASQNYTELSDRRLPNLASGGYQSDMMEDYNMGSINSNLPFPPPLQRFPDHMGRFPENRFNSSGPPPAVPSHVTSNPGSDMLRSIAPHATHVPGYEDMPHFMSANSHQDMSLRVPTVDETLARMKLQGHSIMGSSNDLQTFIR